MPNKTGVFAMATDTPSESVNETVDDDEPEAFYANGGWFWQSPPIRQTPATEGGPFATREECISSLLAHAIRTIDPNHPVLKVVK
jgi:hypothetical protein